MTRASERELAQAFAGNCRSVSKGGLKAAERGGPLCKPVKASVRSLCCPTDDTQPVEHLTAAWYISPQKPRQPITLLAGRSRHLLQSPDFVSVSMSLWQVRHPDVFSKGHQSRRVGPGTRWFTCNGIGCSNTTDGPDDPAFAEPTKPRTLAVCMALGSFRPVSGQTCTDDNVRNAGPSLKNSGHCRCMQAGLWPSGTRTRHRKRTRVRHTLGVLHTATAKGRSASKLEVDTCLVAAKEMS